MVEMKAPQRVLMYHCFDNENESRHHHEATPPPLWNHDELTTHIPLQPGLHLHCLDIAVPRETAVEFKHDQALLEFGCLLSGRIRSHSRLSDGRKHYVEGVAGMTWCSFLSEVRGSIEYLPGQPVRVLVFLAHGTLLKNLLSFTGQDSAISMRGTDKPPFNTTGSLTPDVREIVRQVMGTVGAEGIVAKLFLISKAYELLSILSSPPGREPADTEESLYALGVEKAREILEQNLAAPPSLADIARKSGVCVTCLTEKFRKQFGTTVFGYLRQRRLEQAKELMTRHGLSASEAAWEVGYSSLSSFHRAFMAKYGATPGAYSRKG